MNNENDILIIKKVFADYFNNHKEVEIVFISNFGYLNIK